jgi:hypothetical protein
MSKVNNYKAEVNKLIEQIRTLTDKMPQKGNKPESCQKLCVLAELRQLEQAVNGTEERDFYHEEEEE